MSKRLGMAGSDPLEALTTLLKLCQIYLEATDGEYYIYWQRKGDLDLNDLWSMASHQSPPSVPSVFAQGQTAPAGDPFRFLIPSFRVAIGDGDPMVVVYKVAEDGSDTPLTSCTRAEADGSEPDEIALKLGRHLLHASRASRKLYGVDK